MELDNAGVMGSLYSAQDDEDTPDEERDQDRDRDEAPETPLDEPRPPRIEDPPSTPDQKGPYVVYPD